MSFVQTHLHTGVGSLLDGVGNIKSYVRKAVELGMPAIAVTEHGSLGSTLDFFTECKKNNINPILGEEFYIALSEEEVREETERLKKISEEETEDFLNDISETNDDENVEDEVKRGKKKSLKNLERQTTHQIVLVKNQEGWRNACKLNYYSYLKPIDKSYDRTKGGYYYKPRITREFLFEAKEGLITTSTCLASEINRFLTNGKLDEAYKLVELYKKHFKDDFYIELQINEIDNEEISQRKNNEHLIKIASDLDIKTIMTGDVHYNDKGDGDLQDIIIAIQRGKTIFDEDAFKIHARNLHFHQRDDYYRMNKEFGYNYEQKFIDDCLDTTFEIHDKCNFEFSKKKSYPKFYATEEESKKQLTKYCKELLKEFIEKKSLKQEEIKVYVDRLKYELEIINKNGYTDYFLIVKDIVDFCKRESIIVGKSRGSVGSSLIARLFNISGIDPIEHDLFFERFVNPEALSDPDIDMDFDSERRDEVIEYLKTKWGEDSVIRIANYVTYNIKSCIKDFSRALKRSYDDVEFICSDKHGSGNIPANLTDETVDAWFEQFSDRDDVRKKRIYEWYEANSDIIKWFKKVYGNVKTVSQHAGGVLITPEPVYYYIPVNRSKNVLVTGYAEASTHKNLLGLGLLKIDVLGLETLTMMKKTVEMVKQVRGKDIGSEVFDIDVYNEKLYEEFSNGNNFLIFQFESQGISDVVKKAKPKNITEVAAINSLYRPAALSSGATYQFAEINGGKKEREFIHPLVDKILDKTKGVIAYQEQISQIISSCTNNKITIGQAELYRKAIMDLSGKYKDKVEEFKSIFIKLSVENGIEEAMAQRIQNYLLSNSGYSFNACLGRKTKVLTKNGYKLIKDFKTGDDVLSYDFKKNEIYETTVKHVYKNKRKVLYSIKTVNGTEIIATMNHKFMVKDGTMKTLKNILDNDLEIIVS